MNPRSAKAKGNLLEDFIVERLHKSGLDVRAYRQKGSGSGLNKGDVWNDLNIHFEAKNVDKMAWSETIRQIKKDNVSDLDEALVWHRSGTPLEESLVCIPWHYYERLLMSEKEKPEAQIDRPEVAWLVRRIREDLRKLLKEWE